MNQDFERIAAAAKPLNGDTALLSPITLATLSLPDLLTLDIPDRRKLLPWLPEGGLAMIYGPRGIGKTYFSLSLAVALATPTPFLRWPVSEPCGVLIVDGEMALSALRERLTLLITAPPKARLATLSHEVFYRRTERDLDLGVEDLQDGLKADLEANPDIRVVILDNLSCLLPRVREDQRDDWTRYALPLLLWLRRRRVAVVLVHHGGKSGDQRGTSSREDALDRVVKLGRLPDASPKEGARFLVSFPKSRGAFGAEVEDIEAHLDTDASGLLAWTWKPAELSTADRLLQLIRDGIESGSEAAEELGVTRGQVSKLKKKLQKAGKLAPGPILRLVGPEDDA